MRTRDSIRPERRRHAGATPRSAPGLRARTGFAGSDPGDPESPELPPPKKEPTEPARPEFPEHPTPAETPRPSGPEFPPDDPQPEIRPTIDRTFAPDSTRACA